jgi:hypothetical protein
LTCPICQKRKAKRFCPAKAGSICSVCCGTEREVTIDCPANCPHLIASRQYDQERRPIDRSKVPFSDTKVSSSFVESHQKLLLELSYTICAYARDNPELVDNDAAAVLQALAESYRTLTSGIYYEKPPDFLLQRGLYEGLKGSVENYRKEEARRAGISGLRDSEVRDAWIFLAQVAATHSNGRPKGRAFLDLLRGQFKPAEFSKAASNLVVPP